MDYVVELLTKLFAHTRKTAVELTWRIHTDGPGRGLHHAQGEGRAEARPGAGVRARPEDGAPPRGRSAATSSRRRPTEARPRAGSRLRGGTARGVHRRSVSPRRRLVPSRAPGPRCRASGRGNPRSGRGPVRGMPVVHPSDLRIFGAATATPIATAAPSGAAQRSAFSPSASTHLLATQAPARPRATSEGSVSRPGTNGSLSKISSPSAARARWCCWSGGRSCACHQGGPERGPKAGHGRHLQRPLHRRARHGSTPHGCRDVAHERPGTRHGPNASRRTSCKVGTARQRSAA